MKIGDRVRLNAWYDITDITKNRIYKVIEVDKKFEGLIQIVDDVGDRQWFTSDCYELVDEEEILKENDKVNHPSHYQTAGGIEVIEYIASLLGDNVKYYYLGNVIKYISRFDKKNGVEDLEKARFYLNKMIEMEDK